MGKLIAFWSPCAGKAKVTASMCAVAGAMGLWYPEVEIALVHTKENTELEEYLDSKSSRNNQKDLYEKIGVAALQLNYMQAVLTAEKIRRCAIPLIMKSLYLFPGSGKTEGVDERRFRTLTEKLVDEFEVTFLELEAGWSGISEEMMQVADAVVMVLPQNPTCWESYMEDKKRLEDKKCCVLIGGYLNNSRYGMNYFRRRYFAKNKEQFLGTIPMNAGYMDAMADGRSLDFFLKNELTERKEENYEFIIQTKRIAKYLKTEILIS